MAVTLSDVAERAGVSAATVSRVLNGNYPVAGPTRTRVLRAVEELEYVVNGPASALAASTSDLIGVLVNDIADPFFGIIAGAVQTAIGPADAEAGRGQKLAVVCNTGGSPEQELTYLRLLRRQRAGAVVLAGSSTEDPGHLAALTARLRRMSEDGVRVVFCGRPQLPASTTVPPGSADTEPVGAVAGSAPAGDATATGATAGDAPDSDAPDSDAPDTANRATTEETAGERTGQATGQRAEETAAHRPIAITFDNTGGARALTEHLLALGHRRIGYLAGPEGRTTTRYRLAGHRAALAAAAEAEGDSAPRASVAGAAAPDGDALTVHGAYDRTSGYQGTVELLRREPGVTAILAANDTVALGVRAALRDRGLRVPEDVSVAGFDDLPFAADAGPPLTTVRVGLQEAGALAGRLALGTEPAPPGGETVLGTELIVRASTAPPPAGAR